AGDFGWISMADAVSRIAPTLSTIENAARERGQQINWYDTQRLRPLRPLYITGVEGGNRAGDQAAVAATRAQWAGATPVQLLVHAFDHREHAARAWPSVPRVPREDAQTAACALHFSRGQRQSRR